MIKRHKSVQALLEHQKFLGTDRELTMFMLLILIAINMIALSISVTLISLVLFALCYGLLYTMARNDLLLRKVYIRSLRYSSHYRAQGLMFDKDGFRK